MWLIVLPPFFLYWYLLRWWFRGPQKGTKNKKRLDGKTVVLTGGNAGIGSETAKDLANRGAVVYILCRDKVKAEKTIHWIKSENPKANIFFEACNLASFSSIKSCAKTLNQKLTKVDYLINNAGVMWSPITWRTEEDYDMQFGVNHLGHFLLTELLLPMIKKASLTPGFKPRIINVSSLAGLSGTINHRKLELYTKEHQKEKWSLLPLASAAAYNDSKLANVLHAKALSKRLKYEGINAYSLHPGVIPSTDLFRHIKGLGWIMEFMLRLSLTFMKRNVDGAETTLFCVLDDSLENESGEYYSDCAKAKCHPSALDNSLVDWFYDESLKLINSHK